MCQILHYLAVESLSATQAKKAPHWICFLLCALQDWPGGPHWARSGPLDGKSKSPITCLVAHTPQVLLSGVSRRAAMQVGRWPTAVRARWGTWDMEADSSDKSSSSIIHVYSQPTDTWAQGPERSPDATRENQDFVLRPKVKNTKHIEILRIS